MPLHFVGSSRIPIAFTLIAMGVAFGYYAYYAGAPESIADIFNNNISTF